ncbi:hypothetical protein CRENBAI_011725 [Crenichthys baileyi]|uniref:Uncharacterized protein n=1 Tax=Crenichthys baileyi TaxID=28760 RepID=A0AAV9S4Z7_9TELE
MLPSFSVLSSLWSSSAEDFQIPAGKGFLSSWKTAGASCPSLSHSKPRQYKGFMKTAAFAGDAADFKQI